MPIISGLCVGAKRDFLMGVHQPGDEYKVALYTASAVLNPSMPSYTPQGEVATPGYDPGGRALKGYVCGIDQGIAVMGWKEPVVWPNATIAAYGALIYNASRGSRALVVVDFEGRISSTYGDFRLLMPPVTAETALIRIG